MLTSTALSSPRRSPLRTRIDRIQRLTGRHEQAVALGAAEADIAADFGQPDASDQLALRRPYRHAAVAHVADGIA